MKIQKVCLIVLFLLTLGSMNSVAFSAEEIKSDAAKQQPQEMAAETEEQLSDTWIKAKLLTTYTLNQHLNPFEINVAVDEGVVTLDGRVDSGVEKDLAAEIAKGISGVKKVVDNLTVEPDMSIPEKEMADFAQLVEDATITAKVKTRLLWNRNTEGLDIAVDTDNGVVTLEGKVATGAVRDLAVQIAGNAKNVRKVESKLEVTGKEEPSEVEMAGRMIKREMSDTWITGKVKAVLISSKEAEGADVKVSTRNKIVTLSGMVRSKEQKDGIMALVADVVGVKEVKSDLMVEEK
ncbi:MAG TPA: BON domain-containing protein [Desulfobacteraceae bacterium]|nr:BON domain-containing protein [Desulfobacteraceae bacterium]